MSSATRAQPKDRSPLATILLVIGLVLLFIGGALAIIIDRPVGYSIGNNSSHRDLPNYLVNVVVHNVHISRWRFNPNSIRITGHGGP